jgi:hypothetical protein
VVEQPLVVEALRAGGAAVGRPRARAGAGATASLDVAGLRMRTLDLEELRASREAAPATFLGYDLVTGAAQSWEAADYGEGAIVAILDSGVYPDHPLYAGNVLGGVNLVPADEEKAIDVDGDGAGDGFAFDWNAVQNDDHGTFVAGLVAGHADLEMPADETFALSVLENSPESVTIDGDVARIRLMGTAPAASLFALKVFPFRGGTAPDARIAQALDMIISMKRRGELDVDVVNMSLSGPVLDDGRSLLDRAVDAATLHGITCVVAAANTGASQVSVGTPGSARGALTVGGTIDPIHLRVAIEAVFGLPVGLGAAAYPHGLQLVDFSARGLTADHRVKPDLVASGLFAFSSTLADFSGDGLPETPSFGFGSGTSFSTPTVAGAAALAAAFAGSHGCLDRAPFLAHALEGGAEPIAAYDRVSAREQGGGFVHVPGALRRLEHGNVWLPPRQRPSDPLTQRLSLARGAAAGETPLLAAGESYDFYVEVPEDVGSLHVVFPKVEHEGKANPIMGEALQVFVHSAKRGGTGDYVFVSGDLDAGEAFAWEMPEPGTARVTISGGPLNYGKVAGSVELEATPLDVEPSRVFRGRMRRDEIVQHEMLVPGGLAAMGVRLVWEHDWSKLPTYDLDMVVQGPDGFFPAVSLDSPERAWIEAPSGGKWTFHLRDFSTVRGREPYRLEILFVPGEAIPAPERERARIVAAVPASESGATEVRFAIPAAGRVALDVFDVSGRRVRTLDDGLREAGTHAVTWDGRDERGRASAAGVYFLRLATDAGTSTRKVVVRR